MNKRAGVLMSVVLLSLTLPGCNSILGIKLIARASGRQKFKAEQIASASPFTDAGRKLLDANEIDQAIQNFHLALAVREPLAPAYNGIGVAYARLERFGQAKHYFEMAIALAPTDQRFVANLDRLRQSEVVVGGEEARVASDAAASLVQASQSSAAPAVNTTAQMTKIISASLGRLHRDGNREYSIRTVEPLAAPIRTADLSVDRRFKPLIRFELLSSATALPANATETGRAKSPDNFKPIIRLELPPARHKK
jgi:tetratricopeptide (TPR) repeat protein